VGRTLALDPGNRTAMRALGKVVAAAPASLPKEAAEELDRAAMNRYRRLLHEGLRWDLVAALLLGPIAWWMGIIDAFLLVTAVACTLTASLFKLAGLRRSSLESMHSYAFSAYLFKIVGVLALSRSFGPLLFTPSLLSIMVFTYSMSHHARYRLAVLIGGAAALLAPALGEMLSLVPRSYEFKGGLMMIIPHAVAFPEQPTLIALTVANCFLVLAPALMVGRFQQRLREDDEQRILQTWHLRQLFPDEARSAAAPASAA